uniref:Rubrerythrin n=1 Tax=Geobacter sp. (strain M21) TaxID=443144 RepID=C6E4H7_GEOSM
MSDAGNSVLDALMLGMEMEKDTFDFYVKAAQKTFNPEGKRIFRWLAESEETHYLKLAEIYKSLDAGGGWVFYAASTIELEPSDGEPGVGFETDDIEALRLAREIEEKGIDYFEDLLEKTTDPDGRRMVETLRREEEEHLRVITEKLHFLEGRFS